MLRFFLILAVLTFVALCGVSFTNAMHESKPAPQHDLKTLQAFAAQTNQFGFDLYQQLRQKSGNVFLSPYSISTALAMTAAGAQGSTAEQMTKVLHLPNDVDRFTSLEQGLLASFLEKPVGYEIRIANALWGQDQHPFKPTYLERIQRSFRAEARSLDFIHHPEPSRQTINQWVETQTNQRIKNLLPEGSVQSDTRMVLTNAIYFKGKWKKPFEKSQTRSETFFTAEGSETKVSMMHKRTDMHYQENDLMQMIELPYEGAQLSMVVMVPKKKDGLADVEASLNAEMFRTLTTQNVWEDVILSLPKHKTTWNTSLAKTLMGMGMTDAFTFGKADFSPSDGSREQYLSEVVHKAFCEINEEGTEAAAATGVLKTAGARPQEPPPPKVVQANHPYLFFIRDTQTGTVLFMGRVTQPE